MDGISTAASAFAVVSVAGQLAVGVKNLHSFWSSLRDAPDDVQSLSKELKLLLMILGEIEQSEQRYGPNVATTDILESCTAQINSLTAITEGLERGFKTQNSSRSKWSALKTVFKRDMIKKFQDTLRDTKVTLLLAQQNGFRRILNTHHDDQRDQLSILINELRLQISTSPLTIRTKSAQPRYESHAEELQSEVCRMASTVPNPVFRSALEQGVGRALEEHPQRLSEHFGAPQPVTSECQTDLDLKLQCCGDILTGWSHSVVKNLFGTFWVSSEVQQLAKSRNKESEDLDSDDFVWTTLIRIHPARWLIRLGINFGVQFAAQEHSQCWKHTLTTFRAVPDDAAIFSACRRGDIDGVIKLLTDGKASVSDTDSNGWTPLHSSNPQFAADRCHPSLCRFLISKGADKINSAASYELSPLMLAARTAEHDTTADMQIDTLRLFLNEIDFSEAADMNSDGWRALMLMFFPRKSHDLTFHWLLQSVALEIMMHFQEAKFANILCFITVECDPRLQFLSSMLRFGNDHVGSVLDMKSSWGSTPIHETIMHRSDTAGLIMKGANPHLTSNTWEGLWDLRESSKSPTSFAMLSSRMFYHWRESLQDSGVDLKDFAKRECENGSVVDEGWNKDTLLLLFESELLPFHGAKEPMGPCDKCNLHFDHCGLNIFVEVDWCLKLEKIKKRYIRQAAKDKVSTAITRLESSDQQPEKKEGEGEEEEEAKGLYCPCVQRYTFVCCACWKAIQDPNHEHQDTSEMASSAAIEELSFWNDPPFLLSI